MVNIDPNSAERNSSLYALLHTCRKNASNGKVLFGTLLSKLTIAEEVVQQQAVTATDATLTRWWPIHLGMPCSAR
jgi:hypothetical protein